MHPDRIAPSWYVAARGRQLRPGQARSLELLGRRIALYRTTTGRLLALDARCPHLGADLGQGCVVDDQIRCAFHGWRIGPDGRARAAPGMAEPPARRVRSYPVVERWGLVWLFSEAQPLFELPAPPASEALRAWLPPRQRIACHPHLVIANGLDARHFAELHGMRMTAAPELVVEPPFRVTLRLRGQPASPALRRLTGTTRDEIRASFTTVGATLAWAAIEAPVRFYTLFTARPAGTGCETQLVMLLPRGAVRRSAQALALLGLLLHADRRILERIDFFPGFTADDAGLRAFAELVNAMPG